MAGLAVLMAFPAAAYHDKQRRRNGVQVTLVKTSQSTD